MSLIELFTSLYAPDDCLHCGREGSLLCHACTALLPALPGVCYNCLTSVNGTVVCRGCLLASPLTSINAVTHHIGIARQLVAALKFQGNQTVAKIIANTIADLVIKPSPHTIITHVPATTSHIRQRGYDQAELIARRYARIMNVSSAALLRRIGQQHQLGASKQERLIQLSSAVTLKRDIEGHRILLIDDVITTGSSLHNAAATLLSGGATQVDAFVFAQALPTSVLLAVSK